MNQNWKRRLEIPPKQADFPILKKLPAIEDLEQEKYSYFVDVYTKFRREKERCDYFWKSIESI